MPYDWQPEGLKADDPETTDKNEGPQNALSTGDRQTYIYLIPQETLELKIDVKYHKMTAGTDVVGEKSIDASPVKTPVTISPLKGNTRYVLNITLSDI